MLQLLAEALLTLKREGVVPFEMQPAIDLALTTDSHSGEFTSSLPLKLATDLAMDSVELAQRIVGAIPKTPLLSEAVVGGRGFINCKVENAVLCAVVPQVLASGKQYGFTYQNPMPRIAVLVGLDKATSPFPINFAPVFSTGVSLTNLLEASGFRVTRKLYVNGISADSDRTDLIQKDVNIFGLKIDNSIEEASWSVVKAHPSDPPAEAAVSSVYLIPNDNQAGTAHLSRVLPGIDATCDHRVEVLKMPGVQWGAEPGTGQSLSQLSEVMGIDALRFFSLPRRGRPLVNLAPSQAEFRAAFRQPDNPLYLIQFAHARICSVLRQARQKRMTYNGRDVWSAQGLLTETTESRLMAKLAVFPEIIKEAANAREPHQVISYLQDLANGLNKYYEAQKWLTENQAQTLARLSLVAAARQVLANGLDLIGVSAPEVL